MQRRGATRFEVSEEADQRFLARMLERMEDTVFVQGSCATARSYYFTNEGDAVLLRPTSSASARRAAEEFPLDGLRVRLSRNPVAVGLPAHDHRRVLDALLSGLVTGYAIAMPVGAVAVMIIAVSARTSWRTGAAAGLGVATVDGGYAAVAALAGTAVARALEPVSGLLTAISVAVLLGIAVLTLVHAFRPEREDGRALTRWTPLRAWLTFAAITAINPATVLYFAAIVLGGTVQLDGPAEGVVFVAAAFAASASWQVFVASVGSGLGTWLHLSLAGPRGRRTTGVVAALAVAALALKPLL